MTFSMQRETQSTEPGGVPATRQSLHYSLSHFRSKGRKEANDEANFARKLLSRKDSQRGICQQGISCFCRKPLDTVSNLCAQYSVFRCKIVENTKELLVSSIVQENRPKSQYHPMGSILKNRCGDILPPKFICYISELINYCMRI